MSHISNIIRRELVTSIHPLISPLIQQNLHTQYRLWKQDHSPELTGGDQIDTKYKIVELLILTWMFDVFWRQTAAADFNFFNLILSGGKRERSYIYNP